MVMVGHIRKPYRQKTSNKPQPRTSLKAVQGSDSAGTEQYHWEGLYQVSKRHKRKSIAVTMELENRDILITLQLHTYTGETVKPVGVLSVKVSYRNQEKQLHMYVTKCNRPTLLDREWLHSIRLNWSLTHLETQSSL